MIERIDDCHSMSESWNSYVEAHPMGTVCHRWEWKEVFEGAYGWQCHYLRADSSGAVGGVLPLVRMRRPLGRNRLVSVPYLDQGGLLASSADAEHELFERALDTSRRHRARSVLLRGTLEYSQNGACGDTERFRMVLPLPADHETLWKNLDAKVRNQVRKSRRSELETTVADRSRAHDFYRVYSTNMRDLGSPPHTARFFELVLERFGPSADLFTTSDGSGECVAAAVALYHGDTAVVPWASSLRSARALCPNHSLYWAILERCIERGAKRFDFGRSWADSGTFRFKKQWGAEPVELHWLEIAGDGKTMPPRSLRPGDHPFLTATWGRLPVPVATRIGGAVRRYLEN